MSDNLKEQSNPFSTGGGGVNFETRVQAAFAVALLAGLPVPCLSPNARVQEIRFQSKYNEVHTDDFVIVAADKNNIDSKLYAQVKHEITISESENSTFSEVMKSAWADFKSDAFNQKTDAIALITGPLPRLDVNNTLPVLEWARYSESADEFIRKSNAKGFTSEAKLKRLSALKSQLRMANNGEELSDHQLWSFLKSFHLLSYDLDVKASVVASLLGALIQQHSDESPHLVLAKVTTCVQEFNQNAGTLTLNNAPNEVRSLFAREVAQGLDSDINRLQDRGNHIFYGISNSINGLHVLRDEQLTALSDAFDQGGFILVTGGRGVGKSGVVKDFVSAKLQNSAVYYLRAEDLDKSHLNDVFTAIGMHSTLRQIAEQLSLLKEKVLVLESVEKVLELNHQAAFVDLLNYIRGQQGWTIIATGRDYAYQQLIFNYVQPSGIAFRSINIEGFKEEQIKQFCERTPGLKTLVSNESLLEILNIPFFIDLAVRAIGNGASFSADDKEAEFRATVWDTVISKSTERKAGMPSRRKSTFIEVAKSRAKRMVFGVRDDDFDADVIAKLEEDHLIYRDKNTSLISPSHDVLEDWALEEFIDVKYIDHQGQPKNFLQAIGNEPAINRAFRLWLHRKLRSGNEIGEFIEKILIDDTVESYWKDEAIAAVLQSHAPRDFLIFLKPLLLKNDCELLIRFFFILRITCQRPKEGLSALPEQDVKIGLSKALYLLPYGSGWDSLIDFTYESKEQLSNVVVPHVAEVLNAWGGIVNIRDDLPIGAQSAGLLALFILEGMKDIYERDGVRKKILGILLKVLPAVEQELDVLMAQDVFILKAKPRRLAYVDELVNLALEGECVAMLCLRRPDFIIKLALHEWIMEQSEDQSDEFGGRYRLDVAESYGLDTERGFFPASGAKGPFIYLLRHHPRKALDFIILLCNTAAQKYANSTLASPSDEPTLVGLSDEMVSLQVDLELNDGQLIQQYASPHLWKGYRGHSTMPYLLQSALMAFENWLVEYVKKFKVDDIAWLYDYVIRSSNSVMPTSVLASVAIGFPGKVGIAALPILKSIPLYRLDLQRMVQEMGGSEINWFGTSMRQDVMATFYAEERRVAALRPWRKESLEGLLTKLQFDENCRSSAFAVIDQFRAYSLTVRDDNLRLMIHRADTREWEVVEDSENKRVILQSTNALPEDLQRVQREFTEKHFYDASVSRLYVWAKKAFDENNIDNASYATYQDALAEARRLFAALQDDKIHAFREMAVCAITTTCAVCVREPECVLTDDDKKWCFEIAVDVVLEDVDDPDGYAAIDATDQYGISACAFVLAKMFDFELEMKECSELTYAIVSALTHENVHVCASAAKGVRAFLWTRNSDLASRCLSGMLEYSRFMKEIVRTRPHYFVDEDERKQYVKKKHSAISKFRSNLLSGNFSLAVEECTLKSHAPWLIHLPMFIVPFGSHDEHQIQLLKKIVGFVYESERRDHRSNDRDSINHDVKNLIQRCLSEHVVHSRNNGFQPVRDILIVGCSKAPSFIYMIKLYFDIAMEKEADFNAIWSLWELLAPELHTIALTDVNDRYSGRQNDLNSLLRGMLYSDCPWQGHPSEEASLQCGAQNLLSFFKKSGSNSHVFEALSSLMYHFHEVFFAEGIFILGEKFSANPSIISKQINTAFCLEMSIARYLQVENRGTLNRKMYSACLALLTGIVETGSARAYYLRENLIRTRRIAA